MKSNLWVEYCNLIGFIDFSIGNTKIPTGNDVCKMNKILIGFTRKPTYVSKKPQYFLFCYKLKNSWETLEIHEGNNLKDVSFTTCNTIYSWRQHSLVIKLHSITRVCLAMYRGQMYSLKYSMQVQPGLKLWIPFQWRRCVKVMQGGRRLMTTSECVGSGKHDFSSGRH